MKLFVKNIAGLQLPTQATPKDAAFDIIATTPPVIVGDKASHPIGRMDIWKRVQYIEYGTNLYIAPQVEAVQFIETFNVDASGAFCGVVWKDIGVDYHTQLFPRSSISKLNLVLANSVGTIDNGYRGQICVRFKYIFQPEDFIVVQEMGGTKIYGIVNTDVCYKEGEKIIQIKASPNIPIEFEKVDDLSVSVRGQGGFGSTGK
jgi:dUTPase